MPRLYATQSPDVARFVKAVVIAFVVFAPVSCLWRLHKVHRALASDSVARDNLAAAEQWGRPIIAALDRYHAEHGSYPASLDALEPLPAATPDFEYVPKWLPQDVIASEQCLDRRRTLPLAAADRSAADRARIEAFVHDCIAGVSSYALQTADFPQDPAQPGDRGYQRFGYYDLYRGRWTLGWCQTQRGRTGTASSIGNVGICHRRARTTDYRALARLSAR